MATADEKLLTVSEVAGHLSCSESHVYVLVNAGELRHYRIGQGRQGGVRVSAEQWQKYLQKIVRAGAAGQERQPVTIDRRSESRLWRAFLYF